MGQTANYMTNNLRLLKGARVSPALKLRINLPTSMKDNFPTINWLMSELLIMLVIRSCPSIFGGF